MRLADKGMRAATFAELPVFIFVPRCSFVDKGMGRIRVQDPGKTLNLQGKDFGKVVAIDVLALL